MALPGGVVGRTRREVDDRALEVLVAADPAERDGAREPVTPALDDRARHLAREPSRRDRVHVDLVSAPLDRQVAREVDESALARVVRDRIEHLGHRAAQSRDGGDIDDLATALRDHDVTRSLRAQKGAGQVHVEHPPPILHGHGRDGRDPGAAGVVHEDVDRAELGLRALDHRTDVVGAGDVTAEAKRADPQRRELRGRLGAAFGVACAEHHVRTHLRERCRHLPSEAAASAGDDGDPPAKVEQLPGVHPLPLVPLRPSRRLYSPPVPAFAPSPDVQQRREHLAAFMEAQVYRNEHALAAEDDAAEALMRELQGKAKAAGLWAMFIGPDAGGTGTGFLPYVYLNEVIGRSLVAPRVFGCQAPDTGNAEILHEFGTPEQKARWLRPLVAGEIRSFFAMTEPEVSGSDPRGLRARAERSGDAWVINAHKWFSSGAEGAAFAIVMAVTDPDAPPHERLSQIIVPADTPGFEILRAIPTLGHRGRGYNTHCEVRFTDVRVPIANTLGQPGDGFRIAQKRLGPGRIHHVMRWLGQMQRAFDLMCDRALAREVFGSVLAEKQTVQNWIADSAAEIQACRLLTLQAAHRLDAGDEARVEISLVKFYAARVLHEVIDRAIQVHGALGLTDQTPLGAMYLAARTMRLVDGPDEVHRMVVSRDVLKTYRAGRRWEFM